MGITLDSVCKNFVKKTSQTRLRTQIRDGPTQASSLPGRG